MVACTEGIHLYTPYMYIWGINTPYVDCTYKGILQAAIMTLGLRPGAIMAALRPIPRPYHYKQSLTYNS